MIAFDANVFIYSMDDTEQRKHLPALDCLAAHAGDPDPPRLMWQVACETLAWMRRRQSQGEFTAEEVELTFHELVVTYPLVMPTSDLLEASFDLRRQYSLFHWDSLLLAACITADVDTLYSEDMSHGMTYDSVTVINPFEGT
ncbi:MAG: PIN domain-containing protein [Planctomycetaceae bacterium]|nr:PIN domain-containing protein [Planctomycetaceae bacterium]